MPGPLYIHADGRQVNRDCFTSMLNKTTKFLGLSSTFYKSHSFRIGAASHGARNGMSDAQIRHMGRCGHQMPLSLTSVCKMFGLA